MSAQDCPSTVQRKPIHAITEGDWLVIWGRGLSDGFRGFYAFHEHKHGRLLLKFVADDGSVDHLQQAFPDQVLAVYPTRQEAKACYEDLREGEQQYQLALKALHADWQEKAKNRVRAAAPLAAWELATAA